MSDFKPMLPKEMDVSKVNFSYAKTMPNGAKLFFLEYDGSPIYIQSPEMSLTFDPQVFEDDEKNAKFNVKSNINVSNESSKEFHDKMIEFDGRIKKLGKVNSVEWFKKKNVSDDVIDSMITSSVRVYTDPETGEENGRYPPSFGFKVKKKDGKIQCRCFDENKNELNFNNPDGENHLDITKCLKKGSLVKGLFKCDFVWHSPGKFGCTWSAQQLRVKIPKGFDEYAFMDDSDDEETAERLNQENFVDSDSDSDDGEVVSSS
jgi:hypothetical protein